MNGIFESSLLELTPTLSKTKKKKPQYNVTTYSNSETLKAMTFFHLTTKSYLSRDWNFLTTVSFSK